jgi:hypothetical protein
MITYSWYNTKIRIYITDARSDAKVDSGKTVPIVIELFVYSYVFEWIKILPS